MNLNFPSYAIMIIIGLIYCSLSVDMLAGTSIDARILTNLAIGGAVFTISEVFKAMAEHHALRFIETQANWQRILSRVFGFTCGALIGLALILIFASPFNEFLADETQERYDELNNFCLFISIGAIFFLSGYKDLANKPMN